MIPFIDIRAQREAYKSEFLKAEQDVLDSGCYIGGPEVQNFEAELAKYTGAAHAITCGSGTDAITIALLAFGIQPGDEVIVPDFTFIAPAECVMNLGGIPKFADIDGETLQISPESIESLIGEKTRGIIAVNLFGQCAPYARIKEIARAHGLWLIEDSAQSFGATQGGKHACTFGDISITSFYPAKPLGCYGDGGALFTQDDELAKKIRLIANHGSNKRYIHEICGMNSRLDAIQAAVLRVKLRHLDDELKMRRENARKYDEFFAEYSRSAQGSLTNSASSAGCASTASSADCARTAGSDKGNADCANSAGSVCRAKIVPQRIATGNTSTYAQYTLLVENREEFLQKLENAGIPYCIHYPMPLHEQPCFKGFAYNYNNTNAVEASKKAVSLPFCAFTDIDAIVAKLKQ